MRSTSSRLAPLLAALLAPAASVPDRTTEQGEAQVNDPAQECTAYSYPPVNEAVAAGQFPPPWEVAYIVPNDDAARAEFQSIQSQIPDIPPNGVQPGSLNGDWSGSTYPPDDPNCWWTYAQCTTPKMSGLPPDVTTVPEPNTLGYGFDDGPHCSHNYFYDYLQQNNQKATMFYIGSNVMNWPLEAQRALADGHEICVHTWSHHYMTSLTNEQAFAELYYSKLMTIIKLVVGVTPTCWRPAYGDVDDRVRSIASALGLRNIIWEYDSNDWRGDNTVDANYEDLIARARNGEFRMGGTVALFHELGSFTMSKAMKYYEPLRNAFQYLVPVGVAMNVTQPYVESDHALPDFGQYASGTTTVPPRTESSSSSSSSSRPYSQGQDPTAGGEVPPVNIFGEFSLSAVL